MKSQVKEKYENNLDKDKVKIGILGGSFDPAHKGHLAISREAKKRFKLKKIIWAITNNNPFKIKSITPLTKKIKDCKKVNGSNSFISVRFYEKIIKSNKTIDLINYLKKNKNLEIFFIMGADNLINFHKWHKSKSIAQKCNIIVFNRHGYKKNSLKSKSFKLLNKDSLTFVEFSKVNISSSQLRKI